MKFVNGTTIEPTLDLWARYKVSRREEDKNELTLRGCINNDTDLDGVSDIDIIRNECKALEGMKDGVNDARNEHDN